MPSSPIVLEKRQTSAADICRTTAKRRALVLRIRWQASEWKREGSPTPGWVRQSGRVAFHVKITGGGVLTIWAVLQIPWSQAERRCWLHQTRVFLSKHVFTSAVANLWCSKQWKQSFPSVYMCLPAACNISTLWDHTQTRIHTRTQTCTSTHPNPAQALLLRSLIFLSLTDWCYMTACRQKLPPWRHQMHFCPNGWLFYSVKKHKVPSRCWDAKSRLCCQISAPSYSQKLNQVARNISAVQSETWILPMHNNVLVFSVKCLPHPSDRKYVFDLILKIRELPPSFASLLKPWWLHFWKPLLVSLLCVSGRRHIWSRLSCVATEAFRVPASHSHWSHIRLIKSDSRPASWLTQFALIRFPFHAEHNVHAPTNAHANTRMHTGIGGPGAHSNVHTNRKSTVSGAAPIEL